MSWEQCRWPGASRDCRARDGIRQLLHDTAFKPWPSGFTRTLNTRWPQTRGLRPALSVTSVPHTAGLQLTGRLLRPPAPRWLGGSQGPGVSLPVKAPSLGPLVFLQACDLLQPELSLLRSLLHFLPTPPLHRGTRDNEGQQLAGAEASRAPIWASPSLRLR